MKAPQITILSDVLREYGEMSQKVGNSRLSMLTSKDFMVGSLHGPWETLPPWQSLASQWLDSLKKTVV